jgi:hypothetical protein
MRISRFDLSCLEYFEGSVIRYLGFDGFIRLWDLRMCNDAKWAKNAHADRSRKPSLASPILLSDHTLLCCGGGTTLSRYSLATGAIVKGYDLGILPSAFETTGNDCLVASGSNSVWSFKDLIGKLPDSPGV